MGRHTYEPTASKDKVNRFKAYHTNSNEYIYVDKYFGRSLLPECVDYGLALFFYNGEVFHKHIIELVIEKLRALLVYMKVQTHYHYFCSSLLIVYDSFQDPVGGEVKDKEEVSDGSSSSSAGEEGEGTTHSSHKEHSVGEDLKSLLEVDHQISAININAHQDKKDNAPPPIETALDKVRVSMIDFAHTIHPQGDRVNTVDEGYVYGVTTLIERLSAILAVLETKDGAIVQEFIRNMELVYQNNRK
eukprot:gene24187-30504_t